MLVFAARMHSIAGVDAVLELLLVLLLLASAVATTNSTEQLLGSSALISPMEMSSSVPP
jgi:hypothetical protein